MARKGNNKRPDKSRDYMVTILLTATDRPIELPNIFTILANGT